MPHSDQQGKDVALSWYREIAPREVIDVGAGSGTYAKLMRTDPEVEKDRTWLAVEAWQPYVEQFGLAQLYDLVVIKDARKSKLGGLTADLVIFGDVLEHMTHDEARALLAKARSVAANILVSIPVLHLDQDDVGGNPYERHIDHWTYEAMREELADGLVKTWWGDVLAYYLWSAEAARKRGGAG